MKFKFQPGDVMLTYGSAGFWPPRRWLLWIVYRAIRAYQRKKWGSGVDTDATHVRIALAGMFFEATWPKAKWTRLADAVLNGKRFKVVRWTGESLDEKKMIIAAKALIGTPYDWGDLLDMGISAISGIPQFRIFGDRMKKYRVCSTAAAKVLIAGGATFDLPESQIDPAYFCANKRWKVVQEQK